MIIYIKINQYNYKMTSLIQNCKKIGKYYDDVHKILSEHFKNDDEATYTDKIETFKIVIDTLNMYYDEIIDEELVSDIINRHFDITYKFIDKINHQEGQSCFRHYDQKYKTDEINNSEIEIPKKFKKLEKHFRDLYFMPQPEQRSKEWFDFRYSMITASDIATALGENPYEPPEGLIIKKCDPDFPFQDNKFVHHGKKYEPTATMIYEHIYNIKVTEFGCLKHPNINFLGASPDGIASKATLDNNFSPMLGRMLEIKCPLSREIKTKGLIDGDICPHYYYCQVQIQEECCELEDCDFWQVKLEEYETREEYLRDLVPKGRHTIGDNDKEIQIDDRLKKGCILQFSPKNKITEFCEWDSKYIYPSRLDLTVEEYDAWVLETLGNWKEKNPEMAKDFVFDKVIYWKCPQTHNVLIKRDKKWFQEKLPILKKFWDRVAEYRNDEKMLKKLIEDYEKSKKKKWFRYNTELNIVSKEFTKNKELFLEDNWRDAFCSDSDEDECDGFLD